VKRFQERAQLVVEQYNDYEPLPGLHIDGEQTLGENIADIGGLTVEQTNALRRLCSKKNITLRTVKNTFLRKALERTGKDLSELYSVLEGPTSIFMTEVAPEPAKLIKDFRKKSEKPLLKAAYVQEACYVGDNQLEALISIKSKNELIGEVVGLLQSPAKNVISALQANGGQKIAGLVKTLQSRGE
jgi:large subunit ribosomal protein L10